MNTIEPFTFLDALSWIGTVVAFGVGVCAAADLVLKRWAP